MHTLSKMSDVAPTRLDTKFAEIIEELELVILKAGSYIKQIKINS